MAQEALDRQFNYWQYIISTHHDIFETQFVKGGINEKSIVIHIEIFDEGKGIIKSGWSGHKNIDSALGFLQHVVVPSAYYTFMDRNSDGFFIPLSSFDVVVEEVLKLTDLDTEDRCETHNYFSTIYQQLACIYGNDEGLKKETLTRLSDDLNQHWRKKSKQVFGVKVFYSPEEIADFIGSDDFCEFEEVTEEILGMNLEAFKTFCKAVHSQPFFNKSFIDRLNYTLPYLSL
jgi:hypothetical protein